jgi:hypothetical protein
MKNQKINQLKTAIRDRLEETDPDLFIPIKGRRAPAPYARKLLSFFAKLLYPSKSYREIGEIIGLNYMSVYLGYKEINERRGMYPDIKQDVDYISYRIGLKKIYDIERVEGLLSRAVYKNSNGREVARLIKILTGVDLKNSPRVKTNLLTN